VPWKPSYVTAEQMADYVRVQDEDDEVELGGAVAAASRAIDLATNRQFGKVDEIEQRLYTPEWQVVGVGLNRTRRWVARIDDVQTIVGLVLHLDLDGDQSYAHEVTDYALHPANAAAEGRPWELIVFRSTAPQPTGAEDQLRVTATFGWTSVPEVVATACKIQANRFFARRLAPFGVAGSPESGTELRLLAKVDPDVDLMLGAVRRRWGAR